MVEGDRVRVDAWLWAIRIFRTRSVAKEACLTGKVRVGDAVAKPASKVGPGDEVFVRRGQRRFHLRVEETLVKRVGADRAAECYTDLDPQPARSGRMGDSHLPDAVAGEREPGTGRPTKRDRRRLDRLRGD